MAFSTNIVAAVAREARRFMLNVQTRKLYANSAQGSVCDWNALEILRRFELFWTAERNDLNSVHNGGCQHLDSSGKCLLQDTFAQLLPPANWSFGCQNPTHSEKLRVNLHTDLLETAGSNAERLTVTGSHLATRASHIRRLSFSLAINLAAQK